MSHNSTIEQYLKHSFHLTSIPWTSMDCWLVKVGPSCGLVDDFIHEHSKSAAEYPASSSLSTNLHGLQVISPGKIDLKNLHMDMAVNMGIYSLKHGNFIREKDDKPVDSAAVPKNFRHTHILHPLIFARKKYRFLCEADNLHPFGHPPIYCNLPLLVLQLQLPGLT
jgi:hypothetical protein